MLKTVSLIALIAFCLPLEITPSDKCENDVNDARGKMKPWEKGAWETGKYRNVFLEAGYKQDEINAKLAKAYHDLFKGPDRVYFEVGDSMAYVSDLKNHDARTEGLSYGMMVAVQLNKKDVFDRLWGWTKKYMQHQSGPRDGYFAWNRFRRRAIFCNRFVVCIQSLGKSNRHQLLCRGQKNFGRNVEQGRLRGNQ
jgi:oligosaccharide reducing-end xylanase